MEDHNDPSHSPPSISNPSTLNDPSLQRKHQAMLDRLSNRHQSRGGRSKESTDESSPAFESTDAFLARFSDLKQSITTQLAKIEESPDSFTKSDLDDVVSVQISDIEKLVAENSYHLPSYEVRASLKTVADLKETLEKVGLKLVPRKKFSFKNKVSKQNQPVVVKEAELGNTQMVSSERKCLVMDTPGFRDREGEILVEDFKGKNVGEFTLSNLVSCDVRLMGKSRAIFIHKLRNCKVYAGPAMGSVLIEDAEGCVFVLASHQIRIHNARGCDFYLRARSRPIIEDSNGVRFAPYCLRYDGIDEDLSESKLNEETGNWANVDDFKWLRAVQSPNWSILPENERMSTFHVSSSDG